MDDEVLLQINEAFRLAGELMAELPATQNNPAYLAARCHAIADAYVAVVRVLQGRQQGCADAAAAAGHPFSGEGAGYGASHRPPLDLLRLNFSPGDASLFLGAAPPQHHHQPGRGSQSQQQHQEPAAFRAAPDAYGGAGTSSGGPVRRLASSSSSRSSPPSPVQPRQGRRRRESGEKVTMMVAAQRTGNSDQPPDDGYTWRKYGQKDILGSRYPRSYYRCTHKSYYGCEAKKKVQRLDDDPYTYEVTYCGNHSCLTSTTPLLTLPNAAAATSSSTAVTAAAAVLGQDLVVAPAEQPRPPAAQLSTSIHLGINWMPPVSLGVAASTCSAPAPQVNATSMAGGVGARDTDYPVVDLADVMFNSGSSGGSSMDGIFSSHDRRDS